MARTFAQEIIEAGNKALRQFGTYSWDDKGVSEVLNTWPFEKRLRELEPKQAAEIINEVANTTEIEGGRGKSLASHLVYRLEKWDELFDEPGIEDLYDA
jgi:hypothetical protein